MLSSLRAKLLAWYSVALIVVLTTFAAVSIWSIWRARVGDLDLRLGAMAAQLGRTVSPVPSGGYEVNLAGEAFAGFEAADDAPYFAIWSGEGALIDRSDPLVDAAFPGAPQTRTRDGRREVVVGGDYGAVVLVGQSLAQAQSDLWATIVAFAAAGGVALLLASVGGWILVGRALAPIGRIAQIAEAMSESNLSLRIDTSRTEQELASVATALNQAFDRLQEAFERQTRFTADASHELRTPLATQLAELEWALTRQRSNDEYEQSLRVCMTAARRMRAVVEGLLTLARADAGAAPLPRQPVDLYGLARDVAGSLDASATLRGIQLEVAGEAAIVSGDPDRLRELISNLMGNALQYCSAGGRVQCSVLMSPGTTAILEVSDTGPGIDAEDLPHIFERFYRASKARSRVTGGAGLGLAICKWIAESHGGRIRCESTLGRGTRFVVELPTVPAGGDRLARDEAAVGHGTA
jgi:heavy metal sensor kinase